MKKIIAIFAVFALSCGTIFAQDAPKGGNPGNAAKTKKVVKAKSKTKPGANKKAAAVSPGNTPVAKPKVKTTK